MKEKSIAVSSSAVENKATIKCILKNKSRSLLEGETLFIRIHNQENQDHKPALRFDFGPRSLNLQKSNNYHPQREAQPFSLEYALKKTEIQFAYGERGVLSVVFSLLKNSCKIDEGDSRTPIYKIETL